MNSQAGINNADTRTASELITRLKSSFHEEEFEEVDRVLSAREENLRIEIALWKEKFRVLEIKNGELALAKLQLEDELQKAEHELKVFRETYKELGARVKRAEEYINLELVKAAEPVPEKKRRTSSGNESEAETSRENSFRPLAKVKEEPKCSENGGFGSPLSPQGEGRPSVIMSCSNARPSQRPLDSKARRCDGAQGTSVAAGRAVSVPVIEIDNSDEQMRTCVPNIAASGGASYAKVKSLQSDENGRRCNQIPLLASSLKRKQDDSSSNYSSSSSSDLSGVDRLIASLDKGVKPQTSKRVKLWTSDVEMTTSLIENVELRMSAVCALYRQLSRNVKSASSCSNKDHVEQSDALSIVRLGRYLTEGDPQGKLKKSVQQLKIYDPEGVNKCYAFSLKYSNQLYEIYEKEKDPFFPHS